MSTETTTHTGGLYHGGFFGHPMGGGPVVICFSGDPGNHAAATAAATAVAQHTRQLPGLRDACVVGATPVPGAELVQSQALPALVDNFGRDRAVPTVLYPVDPRADVEKLIRQVNQREDGRGLDAVLDRISPSALGDAYAVALKRRDARVGAWSTKRTARAFEPLVPVANLPPVDLAGQWAALGGTYVLPPGDGYVVDTFRRHTPGASVPIGYATSTVPPRDLFLPPGGAQPREGVVVNLASRTPEGPPPGWLAANGRPVVEFHACTACHRGPSRGPDVKHADRPSNLASRAERR